MRGRSKREAWRVTGGMKSEGEREEKRGGEEGIRAGGIVERSIGWISSM